MAMRPIVAPLAGSSSRKFTPVRYGARPGPAASEANRIVLRRVSIPSLGRCMTHDNSNPPDITGKPRYTWPWFLLGAVVLAIALAVAWMSREVERTRRIRELNAPAPPTNSVAPSGLEGRAAPAPSP